MILWSNLSDPTSVWIWLWEGLPLTFFSHLESLISTIPFAVKSKPFKNSCICEIKTQIYQNTIIGWLLLNWRRYSFSHMLQYIDGREVLEYLAKHTHVSCRWHFCAREWVICSILVVSANMRHLFTIFNSWFAMHMFRSKSGTLLCSNFAIKILNANSQNCVLVDKQMA